MMSASLAQNGNSKLSQLSIALGPANMKTRPDLGLTVLDLVAEPLIVSRYTLGCSSLLPPSRHRVRPPTLEVRYGSLMEMVKRRS